MTPPSSTGTRTRTPSTTSSAGRPGSGGPPPRRPKRRRGVAVANPHRRVRFMLVAAIFIFTVFGAQLLRVQAFDASSTQAAAFGKRAYTSVTPALRGQILDRNGVVLASSV
ncbi:MAG: penicillin-binding protein 2, partial [Actinomycetota bacterium]|nr:penicillin-binding protein 2 [Actinomycetota bacterium]